MIQCDFCEIEEDFQPATASVRCIECRYNYCKRCFKMVHVNKGPLSRHHFVSPNTQHDEVVRDSYHECKEHSSETKKLFCLDCSLCVCFLCKETGGEHVGHKTKVLTNAIVTAQVNDEFSNSRVIQHSERVQKIFKWIVDLNTHNLFENFANLGWERII